MLQIMEGNINLASKTPVPANKRAPAHAMTLHSDVGADAMKGRVLNELKAKKKFATSAYQTFEMQAGATRDILNCATGQTELAKLDAKTEKRVQIRAALTNRYLGYQTKGQKAGGVKTTTEEGLHEVDEGMVICEAFVGGILQIQTSYPASFKGQEIKTTLADLI
jgi:hypothetical protein